MDEKITKEPDIRFTGFNGAWEQRKVGELSETTYGGGTPKTSNEAYWNGSIPWIQSSDLTEHQVFGVEPRKHISQNGLISSATKLVPENSIAIITRVGVGKLAVMPFSYATSQDFLSLSNLKTDVVFTAYLLYKKLQSELNSVQGTSIKGITKDELLAKVVAVPERKEQEAIGTIFRNLDHLITLHQREWELTQQYKKEMLKKMFPREGMDIPEIRFEGFTDAWEQRKLKDFGTATGGTSIESEFCEGEKYRVISIGSYSEQSQYTDQGIRTGKTDKTANRILNKDDLTMILNDKTASGNIIGRVLLIDADDSYVYNQRTERIEVNKDLFVPMFLYQLLNADNIRQKIIKASQGNTQIYVNWSAISEIDYSIPKSLKEQELIGEYFSNLDNLITLHLRELDSIKKLKKAMLKKMFI